MPVGYTQIVAVPAVVRFNASAAAIWYLDVPCLGVVGLICIYRPLCLMSYIHPPSC